MLYLFIAWRVGKAVLLLCWCCTSCSASAVVLRGVPLYLMGVDVHGPRWGIGHASGLAMLLVPDILLLTKNSK